MREAASSDTLKDVFEDHLYQSQAHVQRLENNFQLLKQDPQSYKCEAIEGIVGSRIITEIQAGSVIRDVALIYGIATYGVCPNSNHDGAGKGRRYT
jgi:ferritin-like metal-binding protein YciE